MAHTQLGVNEALVREVRNLDFDLQGAELASIPSYYGSSREPTALRFQP